MLDGAILLKIQSIALSKYHFLVPTLRVGMQTGVRITQQG